MKMATAQVALAIVAGSAMAQPDSVVRTYQTCTPTYPTGAPCGSVAIPDSPLANTGGTIAELSLTVPSDVDGNTILRVTPRIWVQHDYQGDLLVQLVSPAGTVATLINRPGTGPGGTVFGFGTDDYGGFHECSTSGFGFDPMFFTDTGFNGCTSSTFRPALYALPETTAGINFRTTPVINCAVQPCFGNPPWGPWAPLSPLAAFVGESKAGVWKLRVQDFYPGDVGNIRFLGLAIQTITQPTAVITTPAQYSCVCDGAQIIGTANDAGGFIQKYDLEYSTNALGPWTLINTDTLPVINGVLGVWNTLSTTGGLNFLRLTVTNADGTRTQFTTVVYVAKQFDTVSIRTPVSNAYLGGTVCTDGTITDHCFQRYTVEFGPGPVGPFNAVDPVTPIYFSPVINDPLATWNTKTGPTAVADGTYRLRFTGVGGCGHITSVSRDVTIDNTAPVATITSPAACDTLCGTVAITGTATDANIAGWTLQYSGGDAHGWVSIASGVSNATGTLANWNTSSLRRCAYVLRLVVSDKAVVNCGPGTNTTEYLTTVNVGAYANCDGVGGLTANDFQCFLDAYAAGGSCPQ